MKMAGLGGGGGGGVGFGGNSGKYYQVLGGRTDLGRNT